MTGKGSGQGSGAASLPCVSGVAVGGLRLRLPATSANLGPGFDTLALALALYLEIDATVAASPQFSIDATGRNADLCSQIEGNLLLSVYRDTVRRYGQGREAPALALRMRNGIPLGMGCGSSAASRLAGVALAAHFGGLGWTGEAILEEAARLEGHPDNVAACWLGGFVASGWDGVPSADDKPQSVATISGARLATARITPPAGWRALLVLPDAPLATTVSRAVLPESYSRADTVRNLQRVALLTAAFATGQGELLAAGTGDVLHQPYRSAVCPLLPRLLPLAGAGGILSVTLSGAGPGVLLLLEREAAGEAAAEAVRAALAVGPGEPLAAELLHCALAADASLVQILKDHGPFAASDLAVT